jgi:hypothetical protein
MRARRRAPVTVGLVAGILAGAAGARAGELPAAAPQAAASPHPSTAGGAGVEPYAPEVKLDRFEWEKPVDGEQPIRAVRVFNDYGDVRARFAGDRALAASAVIQRLGQSGVGVTVERRGEVIAIHVAYPPGRRQDSDPEPRKDSLDRADLVVFVPEGVSFEAHTFRGMIEARKLRSDVRAVTRDGSVFALTTGAVSARSDSGAITAFVGAAAGAPLVFETRTGAIEVTLPEKGADFDLRAETGGTLESDLGLKQTKAGDRTVGAGTSGAGGALLFAHSDGGKVALLRWPGR